MGLKVRRLKSGFAYYGEYKFGDGSGGQRCFYERIQAGSMRDAKRIYAARRKELREALPKQSPTRGQTNRSSPKRTAGEASAVMVSLLRFLLARNVVCKRDVRELLADAFGQIGNAGRAAAYQRANEFIRTELDASVHDPVRKTGVTGSDAVVPFQKERHGPESQLSQFGNVSSRRVRLVPN